MGKYLLLSAAVVFVGSNAWAEETTNDCCNDACTCHWSYDAATKTINITGTGAMKDYTTLQDENKRWHTTAPWQIYETEAESVNIANGMTTIGTNSFYMMKVQEVSIPTSVTEIKAAAFQYADLRSVVVPEGVVRLGGSAFSGNHHLTEIILPSTLTSVEWAAFFATTELDDLVLSENIEEIGHDAFGTTLQTLYCSENQKALCQKALEGSNKAFAPTVYKKVGDHIEIIDGKGRTIGEYASVHDLYEKNSVKDYVVNPDDSISVYDKTGKLIDKRYAKIYTVEEIMELTKGKDRFRVRLTYK